MIEPGQVLARFILFKEHIYLTLETKLAHTIIKEFHGSTHEGYEKLFNASRLIFIWKETWKQFNEFDHGCDTCQWYKIKNLAPIKLMYPHPIPSQIWKDISIDFIKGLSLWSDKTTIIVVVDKLSKYAYFLHFSHPYMTIGVTRLFFNNIFKLHRRPKFIVCDQVLTFTCPFWKELFHLNGTTFNFSSSYHLQTNRQSKVVNRTLEMYFLCFMSSRLKEWFKWVSWVEYCYNTSWQSMVQKTLFEVMYRRSPLRLINYIPKTTRLEVVEHELIS